MVSGQSHSLVGLVDKPAAPTPSYTPSTPQQDPKGQVIVAPLSTQLLHQVTITLARHLI